MTLLEKILIGAVVICLAIALGFVLNMYLTKPQTITNPVPVFFQGKDSIVIKHHYHIIKDTSKAEVKNDTAKAIFRTQKIFDKDTLNIETKIRYIIPDSTFDIDQSFDFVNTKEYRVDTLKIPQLVPVDYDKGFDTFIGGALITSIVYFIALLIFGG